MVGLFFIPIPLAQGAAPQRFISSITRLSEENNKLYMYLSVDVDDEDGLRDILKDGAVIELDVTITMELVRSWWTNSTINNVSYSFIMQHAPLTREFQINGPIFDNKKNLRDKNLTRLLKNSWHSLRLEVISLDLLDLEGQNRNYEVSVSLNLRHKEVPPWLESHSLFWSSAVVPNQTLTLPYTR